MKRKRFQLKTLTFTILSNEANKVVTRFRLPKIIIHILFLFVIVPSTLLFYFITINSHQQQENAELSEVLNSEENKTAELQEKVDELEANRTKVQLKMEELNQLESQIKEYMTELPFDLAPSGGISITLPEDEMVENSIDEDITPDIQSKLIDQYKQTISDMETTNNKLKHIPTVWPTNSYTITSDFGIRDDPFNRSSSLHTGIDIRGKTGESVYASADGIVTLATYNGGYGNSIIVRHSNTYKTLYAHLSDIKVELGDSVKKGDHIGSIGSTGRSTGPHLHFEVIKDAEPIDPNPFLNTFDKQH
ncbi:peptidoglycan DD-metalloendopeptidase family protein [Virgibacillus byunsanensis]|uniref:Peptidoglycan DD-metalloendopeptidase family protein n=1 Tax=Virgibacillus byunsanensis TaxID=570945 RepID=A0ABW3LPN3_9BACI